MGHPIMAHLEMLSILGINSLPLSNRARRSGVPGLGFHKTSTLGALVCQFDQLRTTGTNLEARNPGSLVNILGCSCQLRQGSVYKAKLLFFTHGSSLVSLWRPGVYRFQTLPDFCKPNDGDFRRSKIWSDGLSKEHPGWLSLGHTTGAADHWKKAMASANLPSISVIRCRTLSWAISMTEISK